MRDAPENRSASSMTAGTQMAAEIVWIEHDRLSPDPGQPRQWFDPVKLQELATSIGAEGQRVAIIVIPNPEKPGHFIINDGERRWRACALAGVTRMKAEISTETDERELFKQSAIANFSREGHTTLEIMYALARIKQDFPKKKNSEIAEMFGKSLGWVQNHLALLRLPKDIQELMHPSRPKNQRLVFSVALQLVPLSRAEQVKFAVEFCTGKRSAKSTTVDITRHRLLAQATTPARRENKSHTHQKITNFTLRVREETELIALMTPETFQHAFAGKDRREIQESLENLEVAEGHIATVKEILRSL